jgi:hypothetical protein
MANIKAAQSGNWSSTATWQGGVLPGLDDIAIANSFTVTIDQDIDVLTLSNSTFGTSTVGGFFQITTVGVGVTRNISIRNELFGNQTYIGVTGLLRISATSGQVNILFPNRVSSRIQGGNSSQVCVLVSGQGVTVNTPAVIVSGSNAGSPGMSVTSISNINVGGATSQSNANGLEISASAVVVISGNVAGNQSSVSSLASTGKAILVSAAADITINGDVIAGRNTAEGGYGVSITSAATGIKLACLGKVIASKEGSPAIFSSSTSNTFGTFVISNLVYSVNGYPPLRLPTWTVPSATEIQFLIPDDFNAPLAGNLIGITKSPVGNYPNVEDVLAGENYNGVAGTLEIPDSSDVSYGVPVGVSTGSALLTQTDITNYEVSSGVSVSTKLLNSSTIDSVGQQITAVSTDGGS